MTVNPYPSTGCKPSRPLALALPPDRAARSVAIVHLIEEMHATLQWLRGSASGNAELASLAQVVAAARAHQDRMSRR